MATRLAAPEEAGALPLLSKAGLVLPVLELVLVAVLYIVGKALKASQDVKDKHIPLILGGAGVFLAMLWVVATGSFDGVQSIALGLFTGIVQGVLVAGCSVYANQLVKQAGRAD